MTYSARFVSIINDMFLISGVLSSPYRLTFLASTRSNWNRFINRVRCVELAIVHYNVLPRKASFITVTGQEQGPAVKPMSMQPMNDRSTNSFKIRSMLLGIS